MNLPIGIMAMTVLIAMASLGFSMIVLFVGIPLLAGTVLAARAAARLERARIHAMLGTPIPEPYTVPVGGSGLQRWIAPFKDRATWRDLLYFVVLCPVGIIQFSLVIAFWSLSLAMLSLPITYRWFDDGVYHFPTTDLRWITVDSTVDALPWSAAGLVFVLLSVLLTRVLAAAHARFAKALLG
ncbi:sensor domain-containing protein [Amycolatopsis sp. 195334CR]|nr:sensor domain-containing protein [Amycolatopsis sp. 195334CR]